MFDLLQETKRKLQHAYDTIENDEVKQSLYDIEN